MKLVIFGCGKIAHRIAKSCKLVEGLKLMGFASHNIEKAKAYAQEYGCTEYGDYDYFLNNPSIDAVYVATYNPSHYELIKSCLEHHKNVICEKPMLSSIKENEELFALAKENSVLLMEAMKAVFLPVNLKIKEMIEQKTIGDVKKISACFVRGEEFALDHWIFDKKTGGALKDVGSYCAAILNFLADKEPEVIKRVKDDTEDHSDRTAEVWISYGDVKGYLKASNEIDGDCFLIVEGSEGTIRVDNFWKASEGIIQKNGKKEIFKEELISDFYYELKHFVNLVDQHATESSVMSLAFSNSILEITDGENI